jgi:hypothetical protein
MRALWPHRLVDETVRRVRQRAALAVAQTLLVMVAHLLTREHDDRDLGSSSFEERDRPAVPRRLIQRLEALGLFETDSEG